MRWLLVVSFALADGAIERRSLGPVSTDYAQEQLGIFKRQVREGTYQKRQPRPELVKDITCSDLWAAYRKDCETREVKRMDRIALAWKHLEPVFGDRPAKAVKPREIAEYIAARRTAGIAPATCNREVAVLKGAYRLAARLEMVEGLPTFPKKLKEAKPRQGYLEESQYKALCKNASGCGCGPFWQSASATVGANPKYSPFACAMSICSTSGSLWRRPRTTRAAGSNSPRRSKRFWPSAYAPSNQMTSC